MAAERGLPVAAHIAFMMVRKQQRPSFLEPLGFPVEYKRLIEECWAHDPKTRPDAADALARLCKICMAQMLASVGLMNLLRLPT